MVPIKTDEEFEKLQEIIEDMAGDKLKDILLNYKDSLENLRTNIRKLHDKYAVKGQLTFEQMAKYNRINKLNTEIAEEMQKLYKDNSGLVKGILDDVYRTSYIETRNIIEDKVEKTIRGIVKDDVIDKAINAPIDGLTLSQRLERNRNDIILDIQQNMARGLQKGETYGQTSNRLKESLGGDAVKAKRIVHTEQHRIMETSKLDSLENAHNQGVKMKKRWKNVGDNKVRPSHKDVGGIGGQVVEFDEDFVNPKTGGKGPSPGNMRTAKDDVNDRCIFVADIEE